MHGLGVPSALVPANVQVLTADDMRRSANVSSARSRRPLASVHLNEAQTNPFQPDVQFRGFVGSPLLGLPQGLAVYQDGVRANEPFGDTMNWDLIPMNAIASMNFMPGSNPLFGLNALGGALRSQTKTGFSHPAHDVAFSVGSFGRRLARGRGRRAQRRLELLRGRRACWPKTAGATSRRRACGSCSATCEWRGSTSTLGDASRPPATDLIGNGPAPVQLLDEDRAAIFTHPDETDDDIAQLTPRGSRTFVAAA